MQRTISHATFISVLICCTLVRPVQAQSFHQEMVTDREDPRQVQAPFPFEGGTLPLMVINTWGREIPDEPRIIAHMGLVYNGTGRVNSPGDPFNVYDGLISIEKRGESSQGLYDKKSYSIETRTPSGINLNVSLLGLPEENDYVLYGPYGDKSLLRNVISYELFRNMGHYAPRTRFFELIINADYKGLYILTEKIKRDRNRVDIPLFAPLDTGVVDHTGGYILRVDKTSGMKPSAYWESDVEPPVSGHHRTQFQYFDPEFDELTANQREYIRSWLHDFETALASPSFRDPDAGYRSYLDIPSFTDLMVLNEFTKDVDAYGYSHYFFKERDDRGGKLFQGPPWDYNLTFGNVDFAGDVKYPEDWVYDRGKAVFWWDRVMQDPWFTRQLYCRWDQLHATLIRKDLMDQQIDQLLETLGEAVNRNFQRWPILGVYVWPNGYVASDYSQEIRILKSWIGSRIDWLECQWGGRCSASVIGAEKAAERETVRVYPNPSDLSRTRILLPWPAAGQVDILITSLAGQQVFVSCESPSGEEMLLPDLSYLPAGIYLLVVKEGSQIRQARLLKD